MAANALLFLLSQPVPLAVVAPAAVAAAAYINAKAQLWYDLSLLACVVPMAVGMFWRERRGDLSLFYDLEYWASKSKTADAPFLRFGNKSWTYRQGLHEVLRYGTWLRSRFDLKKGEIVAMDFTNSEVFVFVWLGLWSIGAKPAFINYNLTGHALVHCVRAATTKIMLIDRAVAHHVDDSVRKELSGVRLEVFTPEYEEEVRMTKPVRLPDEARKEEGLHNMAILIYTSGTTGLPKAAVVSWGKVHAAGGFSARLIKTRPGDVFYTVSPPCSPVVFLFSIGTSRISLADIEV